MYKRISFLGAMCSMLFLTNEASALNCTGKVDTLFVNDWGTLLMMSSTIYPDGSQFQARPICNIKTGLTSPTPDIQLDSSTCVVWYSQLLVAQAIGAPVQLVYDASTCAGVASWSDQSHWKWPASVMIYSK